MKSRLLTFDNLYDFYSKYTRAKHFDCERQGCEPIVVQTPATIKFEKSEIYEGLTAVRLQACHTERNLNSSSISKEVMENKLLPTFKNRPILGYIHDVNGEPHFYGHNMHLEDIDGESSIVYDEIPVGIIPESNEAELKYNSETEKYEVFVSGYIFDEYTKATDIIEREQELAVSVEIAIKQMSYSPKDSCLNIEDGYFSGVTILGVDENGKEVKPGMANSNIKLKDFSESNNSLFSNQNEELNLKLIETLEALNKTLSNFNINDSEESEETCRKEEIEVETNEILVNEEVTEIEEVSTNSEEVVEMSEEVTENESTEEVTEIETEESENPVEDETPEVVEAESEEEKDDEDDVDDVEDAIDEDEEDEEHFELIEKSFEFDGKKFSVSFELSHDDIRYGLYNLIAEYESIDNDWYYIRDVYDGKFVFQGCWSNKIYGQKYTKDENTVALDGERYELFEELLTASEKAELESMRENYSSIETELNTYKAAELYADKMTVFNDESYIQFLDTPEFKELMSKEVVDKYSKEELEDKANIVFSKLVKKNKTFALEKPVEEKKEVKSMFAFGRIESKSSFLDGLLNQKKTN